MQYKDQWSAPSTRPLYLVPLRPKYSPQHPILKNTQPTFLLQCERRSFTPIHNTQYYSLLYRDMASKHMRTSKQPSSSVNGSGDDFVRTTGSAEPQNKALGQASSRQQPDVEICL